MGPIINKYTKIKEKFLEVINKEENKYPLSDREKMFIDTIMNILDMLEHSR